LPSGHKQFADLSRDIVRFSARPQRPQAAVWYWALVISDRLNAERTSPAQIRTLCTAQPDHVFSVQADDVRVSVFKPPNDVHDLPEVAGDP
jgi:hypothetical protein